MSIGSYFISIFKLRPKNSLLPPEVFDLEYNEYVSGVGRYRGKFYDTVSNQWVIEFDDRGTKRLVSPDELKF